MESHRFDTLVRSLTRSRRAFVGGALGLGALTVPGWLDAKKRKRKKRKHRKKRHKHLEDKRKEVIFNDFGCVDVDGYCENAAQCCSGICEGAQDETTCRAHDASTCQADQDSCAGDMTPCTTSTGVVTGRCVRTTGKASYCFGGAGGCIDCARDIDCVPFGGPHAACIVCPSCASDGTQTACVGPAESGG
jgi:hypothetical protein